MTLEEFLPKYLGQIKGYPEGKYVGECLSIVKLYIKECFGIDPPPSGTNSAYGYWSNFPSPLNTVFEKVVNTDTLIPLKGWIAIWQPWDKNPDGHISIVADGSTSNILKNWAQNWSSKVFQLESNRYTNVVGFLKPIKSLDTMTEEQKRILDFLQGKTEGEVREAFGSLDDKKRLEKELQTLKDEVVGLRSIVSDMQKQIDNLASKLTEEEKSVKEWQKEVKTAKEQLENVNEQYALAEEERKKFKRLYEAALEKFPSAYSWKDIFQLIVKKLKNE